MLGLLFGGGLGWLFLTGGDEPAPTLAGEEEVEEPELRDAAQIANVTAEDVIEPQEPSRIEHPKGQRTALREPVVTGEILCTGNIRSRETGLPLAGVSIERIDELGVPILPNIETDERGEFVIPVTDPAVAGLIATKDGFSKLTRSIDSESEPGFVIELALEAACEIVAKLELDDSRPWDKVEYRLWLPASRSQGGFTEEQAGDSSLTQAHFKNLTPGNYSISVNVPTHGWKFQRNLVVNAGESLFVPLRIPLQSELSGFVRWEGTREPVTDIKLKLRPERHGVERKVERTMQRKTETDDTGFFRFAGLGPGKHSLLLEVDGATVRREVDIERSGMSLTQDFEIPEGGWLEGRVEDAKGQSVAMAQIEVSSSSYFRGRGEWRTKTNADGEFYFTALPPNQRLTIRVTSAESGFFLDNSLILEPGEKRKDHILTLEQRQWVRGIVVNSDGQPIEGARLRSFDSKAKIWLPGDTTSSANGEFELGVFGQRVSIRASAEGFADRWVPVKVSEGRESEPIRVELDEQLTIRGRVLDPDGNGVPYARVEARSTSKERRKPRSRAKRCDEFGRFKIDRLQPGDWNLIAASAGWVRGADSELLIRLPNENEFELKLEPDRSVSRLATTLLGRIRFSDGALPKGLRFDDLRGGSLTVDGGQFEVNGVRPGRDSFTLTAEGSLPVNVGPVELAPGAVTDLGSVEFEYATDLRVIVKGAGGAPLRGARVELVTPRSEVQNGVKQQRIRIRGDRRVVRYRNQRTPRGAYDLVVRLKGYETIRRPVTVREQRVQEMRVTLKTAR